MDLCRPLLHEFSDVEGHLAWPIIAHLNKNAVTSSTALFIHTIDRILAYFQGITVSVLSTTSQYSLHYRQEGKTFINSSTQQQTFGYPITALLSGGLRTIREGKSIYESNIRSIIDFSDAALPSGFVESLGLQGTSLLEEKSLLQRIRWLQYIQLQYVRSK